MRRQSGRSSSSSTVLFDVPGFTAMIFAEHTYSSAPLPGIHFLIMDFDSGFCVILTWTNPTDLRIALTSSGFAAPETQHAKASAVRRCLGISRIATTSAIASRPPGFKTRNASLYTCCLSGERLITQLDITTSAKSLAMGRYSISPNRNDT